MTREPRHRNRFIARRPRTSTLVLIALFLGFFTLYVWVRPVTAANSGNVQQGNTAPSQTSTPAYTPAPTHTLSPTHPSHTPTPTTSATGTATPTATTTTTTTPTTPS